MRRCIGGILLLFALLALPGYSATVHSWVNTAGGSWFTAANWSPPSVPSGNDVVFITNSGTYAVTISTSAVSVASITIGGASGTQTLANGTFSNLGASDVLDVRNHGVLVFTNAGFQGYLQIEVGGQVFFSSKFGGLQLYSATITNFGTVVWDNGSLSVGGSNSETTRIHNQGLWQIGADVAMNYGGGSRPVFNNLGTVQKIAGPGQTTFSALDFLNRPGATVEVKSGTLRFSPFQTNTFAGTFNAAAGTSMIFFSSPNSGFADAGGTTTGAGTFQFISGNFYLQTNPVPGIQLLGGDLYINTNTFQNAGAITNLTIDGASLHGPQRVSGTLTLNSGSLDNEVLILPTGQLVLATPGSKLLYSSRLLNQGLLDWQQGSLAVGGTPPTVISNGALWQIRGSDAMNYGGGFVGSITNAGTIRKVSGSGASSLAGLNVVNLKSGLIQCDSGSIQFPAGFTNSAGELRLNSGTFSANGGFKTESGSLLDGNGTLNLVEIHAGTLSPGINGPGAITCPQGLKLGGGAVLAIEGTGTTPGSQYDQLTVNGPIDLGGATLQVKSLPNVPVGTVFTLIRNTAFNNPISGTFAGLPENAVLTVSGQPFRIHYAAGNGADVMLVRDTGLLAPLLSVGDGAFSKGTFKISGLGGSGVGFQVLATTNFLQWTNIGFATSDLSGNLVFVDTNASKFRYRFYRLTN